MPPPHEMAAQYSARATLKIDLGAVQRNYHALQNKLGRSVKLAASIKADAYGLGAIRVGKTLYGAGCRNFFVATPGEGKILRQAIGDTASIFILNGPAPRDLALYHGADLKPVINSFEQAKTWLDMISEARRHPACAIHIDTGMNRLGFTLKDLELLAGNKRMVEKLVPVLIMSHLACASDTNSKMNDAQLGRFRRLAAKFPVMPLSLANSPGIYLGKSYHFQMVRAGLGLYAKDISNDKANNITENALSLMAPVLQVRDVAKGESLGYNASYVAKRDMKIAIVGAGYADGIPVASSSTHTQGGGYARMQGLTVPIVGRVSMDLTMLEVTNLRRELQLGDWAEFLGNDLLALAKSAGTIPYEILVRMGSRCRRDYFSSDPDS